MVSIAGPGYDGDCEATRLDLREYSSSRGKYYTNNQLFAMVQLGGDWPPQRPHSLCSTDHSFEYNLTTCEELYLLQTKIELFLY